MPYRLLSASMILLASFALTANADSVFVKGGPPVVGEVKAEDAKTVTVLAKKKNEIVSGADVIDIHYEDVKPASLRLSGGAYKIAKDKEKEAETTTDPVKRKDAYAASIKNYAITLNEIQKDTPSFKYSTRTFRYKIAVLMLRQALSEKLSTTKAIAELQQFRVDFPNSWQINQVMPLIAQTQMDAGDFKGAAATFEDMALMDSLPAEVKSNAELMTVQVAVRAGDIKGAQKKLDALEKKAAGNPKFASRIKMTKAEVLVGDKKIDEAMKLLHQVVKENNDKDTKALAHNTLGECLFKVNRYNEALWEFIWVDAVFNQDRNQHAKSLYYLWKTFEQLNNAERAQDCRESLLGAAYSGTEWQQRALKETGK